MNLIALPIPRSRRKLLYGALPAVVLSALVVTYVATRPAADADSALSTVFEPAALRDLDVRIVKDGELQAINNVDIFCNVEGITTVQSLVKEGTFVHKGDVLMTLDASAIKQKIEDNELSVQQAEADLVDSKELLEIQKSQNASNLEAADVTRKLAQLDYDQYAKGTYPQKELTLATALKVAQMTLDNKKEYLQQTNELYAKGFETAIDVKNAEQDVVKAQEALDQAQTDLKVLRDFEHNRDLTSYESSMKQAEKAYFRTQQQNSAALAQRQADYEAKSQGLSLQKRRLDHYKEQADACTVVAPSDGLVVYASSVDRTVQNALSEGVQVHERQLLLRLPDISAMKAVVRVQEAQVSRLHEGERALVRIVGVPKPVGATVSKISVLADNSQRWWNPDLKEYPVDLVLDETPKDVKPGVGANADIYVERLSNVLTVPITALYASGSDTYVFLKNDPGDPKPRKVVVGATNDTHAQITSGLQAGENVLILQSGQGRDLLAKAGVKETTTAQPSDLINGRKQHHGGGGNSPVKAPAPPAALEKKPKPTV